MANVKWLRYSFVLVLGFVCLVISMMSSMRMNVTLLEGNRNLTALVTGSKEWRSHSPSYPKQSEDLTHLATEEGTYLSQSEAGLRKLPWTSIYGERENDSFHFFSAYFDDRVSAHGRPAVFVMGYSYNAVYDKGIKLYCVFKYPNGSTVCRSTPTSERHPSGCQNPSLGAKPRHYICSMKAGEEPPAFVRLTNSSECEPWFASAEIPVQNRQHTHPTKKFGVCISGPLIQESREILHNLIQFVELSRLLGAEFIIVYVNETQVDKDILEYLWTHYSGLVRTIGWKQFEKWHPLHYYGQLLIISDCYYRVMYEVENLAMIDIDEMIIPVKHKNWEEMLNSFRVRKDTSVFKFQNAFFDDPNPAATEKLQREPQPENPLHFVPKYFTHTRRHTCFPGYIYRTKIISQPRFVVEPAIHGSCTGIVNHSGTYNVPSNIGILAHYRVVIPDECKSSPSYVDEIVTKFKDKILSPDYHGSGQVKQ